MEKKDKILNFIKKQNLCVISTSNKNGKPESAVVAFSETDNLELIFGTFYTTRKYKNLQGNKNVSVVIGWDADVGITVQYEGVAEEMKGRELDSCRDINLKKNPYSKKYAFEKEQRYFKIKPKWIRYSDFENNDIFEMNF